MVRCERIEGERNEWVLNEEEGQGGQLQGGSGGIMASDV